MHYTPTLTSLNQSQRRHKGEQFSKRKQMTQLIQCLHVRLNLKYVYNISLFVHFAERTLLSKCTNYKCDHPTKIVLYLRNREHFPCFHTVIKTRVEVWENEKLKWKHELTGRLFSRFIEFSQTFTSVSITVWEHGEN